MNLDPAVGCRRDHQDRNKKKYRKSHDGRKKRTHVPVT